MNQKRQTTTSTVLDFKNSTSKSSSLIRNFINQVNSNIAQNPPHSHTKSIQAIKGLSKEPISTGNAHVPASRAGKDLKNSGSQNIVPTLDSATTPQRGISNRNRHVNPYIQSKNRQGSMIGSKNIVMEANSSVSRNQTSQDGCNSMIPKNEDKGGLLTNQSVSPIVGSPLNSKNEISAGLLQNLIVNDPKL